MAEGEATQAEGQQGAEGAQQEAPDLAALDGRMTEFGKSLEGINERLEGLQAQAPEEGEVLPPEQEYDYEPQPQYDQFGNLVGYEGIDPSNPYVYDPQAQMDPQAAQAQQSQMIQQAVQQQVGPLQEQLAQMTAIQQARDIESEFPELQQKEVVDATVTKAKEVAEQIGDPELASNPAFLRMTYLAQRAETSAESETPAGGAGTSLEGAGGASPEAEEVDPTDSIVAAVHARQFRPGVTT